MIFTQSFENLEGQIFNTIEVDQLVSNRPTIWACRCTRCGTRFNESHERVRRGVCPNSSCGRQELAPRSRIAQIGQRTEATRSATSDAAREFRREEAQQPTVRWTSQPSLEAMQNASPDSLRRFLDWKDENR